MLTNQRIHSRTQAHTDTEIVKKPLVDTVHEVKIVPFTWNRLGIDLRFVAFLELFEKILSKTQSFNFAFVFSLRFNFLCFDSEVTSFDTST